MVILLWRVADIIPYENISISSLLPLEMRRVLQRAFMDLMRTPEGRTAVQKVYGIDELQIAEEAMYQEFGKDAAASKLDLIGLVQQE
jgi:ABC-type phosphate/phosphonate transport system substrate-binding protein